MNLAFSILFLNGIYDILCGVSILFFDNIFSKLHIKLFKNIDETTKRLLAYWIITYGFVRLFIGYLNLKKLLFLGIITYILEAFFLEYELFNNKDTNSVNIHIVSISSLLLSLIILFYSLSK